MKKNNLLSFILGFCLFLLFIYMANYDGGDGIIIMFVHFMDIPSLFCIVGITLTILAAGCKTNTLLKAIIYAFQKKTSNDSIKSEYISTINCAIAGVIISGFIGGIIYSLNVLIFSNDIETIIDKAFMIFLPPLYSFIICAVLIPIKYRLEP